MFIFSGHPGPRVTCNSDNGNSLGSAGRVLTGVEKGMNQCTIVSSKIYNENVAFGTIGL